MIPLYDENRSGRRPYVTWGLISLNVLVFLWEGSRGFNPHDFIEYGAIPLFIVHGLRLHTLLTSMFMHSNLFHIGGNMLYLYIFGDNVEDQFGRLKYLLLYLLFGVVGGVAHSWIAWMVGGYGVKIPAVGASGAISGVLGAYLVLFPNARIVTLVMFRYWGRIVRIPSSYYLGFWFLYQLLLGLVAPTSGVAFWAHIGGFVAGVLAALPFRGRVRRRTYWGYYY